MLHIRPRGAEPKYPQSRKTPQPPRWSEGTGPQWVVRLGGMGWGRWPRTRNTTLLCSREGAQLPWSWDLQTLKPFPVMLGTKSLATYQGRSSLAAYSGRSSLTSYSGLNRAYCWGGGPTPFLYMATRFLANVHVQNVQNVQKLFFPVWKFPGKIYLLWLINNDRYITWECIWLL